MATNLIESGFQPVFTAPAGGVVSGQAYLIGTLLVVALSTVAAGLPFACNVRGVWALPKAAVAMTEGAALFWDNTAKNATTVATANTPIGFCATLGGNLATDTIASVLLTYA